MARPSKEDVINELDALGVEYDENELSYSELLSLLKTTQVELKAGKHNGEEFVAVESPKPEVKKEGELKVLPSGLEYVKVTHEELMDLQNRGLLVGYEPNQQLAIIRKGD